MKPEPLPGARCTVSRTLRRGATQGHAHGGDEAPTGLAKAAVPHHLSVTFEQGIGAAVAIMVSTWASPACRHAHRRPDALRAFRSQRCSLYLPGYPSSASAMPPLRPTDTVGGIPPREEQTRGEYAGRRYRCSRDSLDSLPETPSGTPAGTPAGHPRDPPHYRFALFPAIFVPRRFPVGGVEDVASSGNTRYIRSGGWCTRGSIRWDSAAGMISNARFREPSYVRHIGRRASPHGGLAAGDVLGPAH
ncbi:hypothetical protein KM043_008379 [Ampulex compressa]|nr:hypothetical protein KM043_008379 [Ampulex compressa]